MCILTKKELEELKHKVFPYDKDVKVSENGFDLRLGDKVGILPPFIDLKKETKVKVVEIPEEGLVLKRGQGYLLHTKEYIVMPEDVAGMVALRSTLARCGVLNPVTLVDSGFQGQIVIEFFPSVDVKVYSDVHAIHLIMIRTCTKARYQGRYQGQRGIVGPKLPLT